MELILRDAFPLSDREKNTVNSRLDSLIHESKNNNEVIQKLMSEAVSLATKTEARADGLKKQGLLGRLWGDLIGANHKTSANNQKDLATAQYISQQVLIKLSEQNTITLDMVEDLSSKMHYLANKQLNTDNEVANLHAVLEQFFVKIRNRFDRVENKANLNFWVSSIVDHEILSDKTYSQLALPARLMCLANEFFVLTKGRWDKKELAVLKGAMRLVGVDPAAEIKPIELFKSYQEEPVLLNKLLDNVVSYEEFKDNSYDTSLLVGFTRAEYLRIEVYESVKELARLLDDKTPEQIILATTTNEVLWAGGENPAESKCVFEVVEVLLNDLKLLDRTTQDGTGFPRINSAKSYPSKAHLNFKIMNAKELKSYADKGNALAQYYYGVHLENSTENSNLKEDAFLYYNMSAEQGLLEALDEVAFCYDTGLGVSEDEEEAREFYKKATYTFSPNAIDTLASEYWIKDEYTHAAKFSLLAAGLGNSSSMHRLGILYQSGEGVKKDIKKAFSWFQKSAIKGDNSAYFELSECYRLGKGIEKNIALANIYCFHAQAYEKEDKANYREYHNHYFETYWNGADIQEEKFFSLCQSVSETDSLAQLYLGHAYKQGWGCEENEELGNTWLFKAADNGLVIAQEETLRTYDKIVDVCTEVLSYEVDSNISNEYLSDELKCSENYTVYLKYAKMTLNRAEDLGPENSLEAMFFIGCLYLGYGEFYSEVNYFRWLEGAARLGDENSIRTLTNLYMEKVRDISNTRPKFNRDNAIFWNRHLLLGNEDSYKEQANGELLELGYAVN